MVLSNFYSNIWIYYNTDNTREQFLVNVGKIKDTHHIKTIINIDKEFKFWDFNEQTFNMTIATQVILDKQNKCLQVIKSISNILQSSIITNKPILIITFNKFDIIVTLFAYFLNKYGEISLEKTLITINSKLHIPNGFKLNSNLKKILISQCN